MSWQATPSFHMTVLLETLTENSPATATSTTLTPTAILFRLKLLPSIRWWGCANNTSLTLACWSSVWWISNQSLSLFPSLKSECSSSTNHTRKGALLRWHRYCDAPLTPVREMPGRSLSQSVLDLSVAALPQKYDAPIPLNVAKLQVLSKWKLSSIQKTTPSSRNYTGKQGERDCCKCATCTKQRERNGTGCRQRLVGIWFFKLPG